MKPLPGDVHVNTPLSNMSIAFFQAQENFVADRVFPNIPVGKKSDRYYTYDRGYFNRDEMKLRAPATESAGGHYSVDNSPNYSCAKYAFHHDVDDDRRANADSVIEADAEAMQLVTLKALLKREVLWAANYFATSKWTTDMTGVAAGPTGNQFLRWDDAASDPVGDVETGKGTILESTAFEPNTLVIGYNVWKSLKRHPDIVDLIKYGQTPGSPAVVTLQAVASILELDRILVMKAIQNTAKEGATNSHSFIGGNHALLCYSAPAPGLRIPSAGYTFSWTGLLGAGSNGTRIKKFRIEAIESDRIEIEMAVDQKLTAADLGYFFSGAVG